MKDMGVKVKMKVKSLTTKAMKVGTYEKLDAMLYIWFRQQREKKHNSEWFLFKEKAKLLFNQLYPDSPKPFNVNSGFQWQFSKQHSLKNLSIQGEQVSAVVSACDFQFYFSSLIENYTHNQVFNCYETSLQYHLLPQKTLASLFEKLAEGRKKIKGHVIINACANITGSIKLPLLY